MALDFRDRNGNWVLHYNMPQRTTRYTKIGQLHADMTKRCTEGSPEQLRHEHYRGCTMSVMFKSTNSFGDWVVSQIGYGACGYQLDKDILFKGNKLYSEDTCVFVPNSLNKFLTKRQSCRGGTPIGVNWKEKNQKYQASFTAEGKSVYLGLFSNVEDGFKAYKIAKETEAKRLAYLYEGQVDPRVIEALINYEVEITD